MRYIIDTREMIDSMSITDLIQWQINKEKRRSEIGIDHTRRVTATLSNDASIEELRTTFEILFEMPEGCLRNWNPKEGSDIAEGKFRKVLSIIEPQSAIFKQDSKTPVDKFEELEQLGKFIVALDNEMGLELQTVPLPYPDFIVTDKGRRIGVEHTRLINGFVNSVFNRMQFCVDSALKILENELPGTTGNFNVYLSDELPVINGKTFKENLDAAERETVAKEIALYIKSILLKNPISHPSYIISAIPGSNPGIPLNITVGQDYIPEKPGEAKAIILKRIAEKEKKYRSYASDKSLDAIWLLIAMQGVRQSSGYKLENGEVPETIESQFEKIFVFDSFNYEYKEILTRHRYNG